MCPHMVETGIYRASFKMGKWSSGEFATSNTMVIWKQAPNIFWWLQIRSVLHLLREWLTWAHLTMSKNWLLHSQSAAQYGLKIIWYIWAQIQKRKTIFFHLCCLVYVMHFITIPFSVLVLAIVPSQQVSQFFPGGLTFQSGRERKNKQFV